MLAEMRFRMETTECVLEPFVQCSGLYGHFTGEVRGEE